MEKIQKIMENSSRWRKGNIATGDPEFIDKNDKENFYKKIFVKFNFGKTKKINIKPKLNYDIIIKTREYSPKKAAKFVVNELNLIEI